jgi:MYXO-CTERM domain-containing protein
MTGGVYYDAFGNVAAEGWGGCSYDAFGNLMCPPGGPTNQVDLFLVYLGDDVAWVDIDSSSFSAIASRIVFSWGLLDSPGDSFQIAGIPEPELSALAAVGLGVAALRRRRKSNKMLDNPLPRSGSEIEPR